MGLAQATYQSPDVTMDRHPCNRCPTPLDPLLSPQQQPSSVIHHLFLRPLDGALLRQGTANRLIHTPEKAPLFIQRRLRGILQRCTGPVFGSRQQQLQPPFAHPLLQFAQGFYRRAV